METTISVGGGGDEEEGRRRLAELFGPGQVDQLVRQAVQFCWMSLAGDRRTVDEVDRQMRRIVDRALADFREDRGAFGVGDAGTP